MNDGSWHYKLARAEKHLAEIHDRIRGYSDTSPYLTMRDVETYPDPNVYVVRAWLLDFDLGNFPNEIGPVIGDVLQNMRSALDHLYIALLSGRYRKKRIGFPIRTTDPATLPEGDPAKSAWEYATKGLRDPALAAVERFQPYQPGNRGKEDLLALLDGFAREDRHRDLVLAPRYLRDPQTTLTIGDALFIQSRPGEAFQDGAVIAAFPLGEPITDDAEVNVHAHGTIEVGLKRPEDPYYFGLTDLLGRILVYVTTEVVPAIEPFVR